MEKARVILEKILLLNPNDEITKEKLIEINTLLEDHSIESDGDDLNDVEDLSQAEFLNPPKSNVAEKPDEKQGLMDYFDSKMSELSDEESNKRVEKLQLFLAKIKEKAQQRIPRESGTTP
jgi:hypothetical protein